MRTEMHSKRPDRGGSTVDDGLRKINRVQQSEDAASDDGQNPESSRQRDVHTQDRANVSISKEDPVLQSNHKIFLSHSGHQKDFAEELCGDLEKRHRFPFFDRRPSSLPKGERFPELIFKAAEQCVMAVVVVSEEYFASKCPMLELNAFVRTWELQEKLKRNTKLKILPLFYGLSLSELHDQTRREKWLSLWEDWAKKDPRIVVSEWKHCLEVMASFNGVPYYRETRAVKAYRDEIVNHICNIIPSDIEWDDSHVQGGSYLCQVIQDKIQQIQASEQSGVCLVGVYGVGGLGKTTLCKILCNKLCEEFKGKVGHVELGSRSCGELLKEVLKDITNTERDFLQQLNEGQCWNVLRNEACKQKMFLAIDNVWPHTKSIEEAKKYLQAGFHKESVVMVTSRALETLTSLGLSRSQCFEMPSLGDEDAMNLFLHHAAYGVQFPSHDDNKRVIEECVARGYFREGGNEKSGHYLPLVLKALGVQLGYAGKSPSEWVQALPEVQDFNYLQEKENPVFSILRSSFDCLRPVYQSLFMDLILFKPPSDPLYYGKEMLGLMEWLALVYNQDMQVIETWLQHLKGRGLLEDVDMTCQSVYVHDVYREFARLEAEGKLNESAEFGRRKWVYYRGTFPAELETTPDRSCWQNLIRVGIVGFGSRYGGSAVDSLQGIEWLNCSNVVVLKLGGLDKLRGDLNLKGFRCLRSLELVDISAFDTLDGLQDLKNLTFFGWMQNMFLHKPPVMRRGLLPASIKRFRSGRGSFTEVGRVCPLHQIEHGGGLELSRLNFSNCTSLKCAVFQNLKSLKILSVSSAASMSCLQSLKIDSCHKLVEVLELGDLVGLRSLHLEGNSNLKKLPNLKKLSRLEVWDISESQYEEVPGLGYLRQLRELKWMGGNMDASTFIKLRNLSGLEQLDFLDFRWNVELRSLEGVFGDLPALRRLNLYGCHWFSRLPDLSRSRNLEEPNQTDSRIEVGEADMCMLALLPLLHPVVVGFRWSYVLRLDVVGRKVLKRVNLDWAVDSWLKWTQWEERDLSMLPIKVSCIEWAALVSSQVGEEGLGGMKICPNFLLQVYQEFGNVYIAFFNNCGNPPLS